ncbi:MAG: hypothetical protein LBP60_02150 [Spirochaetaceae bacterium]|jgi:hypothetical protein|nr:hypothetical protein [Spirochaetaceae bacterium]
MGWVLRKLPVGILIFFALCPVFGERPDFSLNAGGGALLGGLFTRYTLTGRGTVDGNPIDLDSGQSMNQFNFGGFVFFDATYGELSVGIQKGLNNYSENMSATSGEDFETGSMTTGKGTEIMLGITFLGKYPFALTENLVLFPLLGVEYQLALEQRRKAGSRPEYDRTDGIRESDSDGEPYTLASFNSFFIDIGVGADIKLSMALFLRTEFLYSFRLPTPYELDALKKPEKWLNVEDPNLGGLTSGPSLRAAIGYRI